MGAFFTNVQVRRPSGTAADDALASLERAIGALAQQAGLEAAAADAAADRTVVLAPHGDWIAILDEATESQDVELLDRLAAAVSRDLTTAALSILVHDSVVLELRLFDRGKRVARKPERWCELLGGDAKRLRAVWQNEALFAEHILRGTAAIFGLAFDFADIGYGSYAANGEPLPGARTLRFRAAVRPAHEADAVGPPRFVWNGSGAAVKIGVGETLQIVARVRNEGGSARGVRVVIAGSAVERDLVGFERVQLVYSGLEASGRGRRGAAMAHVEQAPVRDGAAYTATFNDFAIPAGPAGGLMAADVDPSQWMALQRRTALHLNVYGRGVASGAGEATIDVIPIAAPSGHYASATPICVVSAPRRPLRAAVSKRPGSGQPLHALAEPRTLVALAVSSLTKAETAPIAAGLLARVARTHWATGAFSWGISRGSSTEPRKPLTGTVAAGELVTGAVWKKLVRAFASDNYVSVYRRYAAPDAQHVPGEQDAFGFGTSVIGHERDDDRALPVLAFHIDLAGRADAPALLSDVKALLDDFVARTSGPQAFVARWQARALGHDTTTYERACGIHGPATLARSWATRWLRAASVDGMWLGPTLLARVDRAVLANLATLTPVGEAVRVELAGGSTLDSLEQVLAPILPSEDDGRAAVEWQFGRRAHPPGTE